MRLALLILFLIPLRMLAANGDILSVAIGTNGWFADITIAGLSTNGTYAMGLGPTNNPATGTPKITFTVVSLGFTDTGSTTTVTRLVYGTKFVRKPTPGNAFAEESLSGSDVIVRVALSDYIYAKDATGAGNSGTAPAVSILSGFYTQGGTPNNASGAGFAVSNNSTLAFPRPVASWSWPDRDVITGSTWKLRSVAFGRFATQGEPIQCVIYTATDGSTTITQTVTSATIDNTVGDAVPVVEYIGTMPSTSLTQGSEITCNAKWYPHIGDAPLDTADGTNSNPSANYAPQVWLNDRTGAYGGSEAFVDATNGTANGVAVARGTGIEGTTPAFQTIYQAANAIILTNQNDYTRKSSDRSIIYLTNGTYAAIGAGTLPGSLVAQKTYLIIKKSPGATRAGVILSGQAGSQAIQQYLKLEDVTLGNTTATMFTGQTIAWADNCTWNQTTANRLVLHNNTVMYSTRSACASNIEGFIGFGAVTAAWALFRGNDFTDYAGPCHIYTFIGNKRDKGTGSTNFFRLISKSGTSLNPLPQTPICAFNKINWLTSAGGTFHALYTVEADAPAGHVGSVVAQNVFEQCSPNGSPVIAVSSDASDNDHHNVLMWCNTSLGQRNNNAYNDAGSTPRFRLNWSLRNNLVDNWNIKTDTFAPADAGRIGNWAEVYGVGGSGNFLAETLGTGAAGQFNKEFPGLGSLQGNATSVDTYLRFVDRQASYNAGSGAGMGNYRLQSISPAVHFVLDWPLPFDIEGNNRGGFDPPGAYASASPRKGGFFF